MALLLRMAAGVRAQTETSSLTPAVLADRQVGIAYSAWHDQLPWHQTWDVPQLGPCLSNDPRIVRQHAEWLWDANVDFIYIDRRLLRKANQVWDDFAANPLAIGPGRIAGRRLLRHTKVKPRP